MKSLFILSLPRSLSSQVHHIVCATLGLRTPSWTTAGEIMNGDRLILNAGQRIASLKYTTPQQRQMFDPAKDFLAEVIAPDGFAYKDVVQPFVVCQWLRDNPDVNVLKIKPNIAHVACAMMRRNWLYPIGASVQGCGVPERMMSGLFRASQALDSVPGEVVAYEDLIFDLEPLRQALSRLYPDQDIPRLPLDPDFRIYRDQVLQRRIDHSYLSLQHLEGQIDKGIRISAAE